MGIIINTCRIWNFCFKITSKRTPSGLQPPVVQVQVKYAQPQLQLLMRVTQVIEEVIGGAEGIKYRRQIRKWEKHNKY